MFSIIDLFLYLVLPIILAVWILRRPFVQNLLEPLRNKLYTRHLHNPNQNGGHGHSHDNGNNGGGHGHSHDTPAKGSHGSGSHAALDEAKLQLFQEIKSTKSKIKELRDEGLLRILEIGVGTGANFKYYPEKCKFIGVDPNTSFKEFVMENLSKFPGIQLEKFIHNGAEDLSQVADNSVDAVVTTAVLCSVKDLQKVFGEVRRVLVPGGKYYYMEHIADDRAATYWMQKIFTVARNMISYLGFIHAAHLDRKIDEQVLKAGFTSVDQKYTRFDFGGDLRMKLASRHAIGVAVK